mgnify:FL=1|jgi:hypothetical protein
MLTSYRIEFTELILPTFAQKSNYSGCRLQDLVAWN